MQEDFKEFTSTISYVLTELQAMGNGYREARLERNRFFRRVNKLNLDFKAHNVLHSLYRCDNTVLTYAKVLSSVNFVNLSMVYKKSWIISSVENFTETLYAISLFATQIDSRVARFLIRKKLLVATIPYKEWKIQKALGVAKYRFYELNENLYKRLRQLS